jgi:hypothetical protein
MMRVMLYEAAQSMLHSKKWSWLKAWATANRQASRREQIRIQVALITPLIHIKGYAAPETQAATERARVLIEQAEALDERLEDPKHKDDVPR